MPARFRLFAQPPVDAASSVPEVVSVSTPYGRLGPGPSDGSMYVVEPVGKRAPYGVNRGPFGTRYLYLPPWNGACEAPVEPDPLGNFDYLTPADPGFAAAHAFGAVRFTLDVWERYLGQPVSWHFGDHLDRLEISLLPQWDNAQYGYGFLELGNKESDGDSLPFHLDFDVIAHEVGHAIIYDKLGVPDRGTELPEYLGFQESFSDCVSLIAAMHFPPVLEEVLDSTQGNLYLANRLSSFSEYSTNRQIRSANNALTMADFVDSYENEHELSKPLTGAIFDILIDVFHRLLVEQRVIPARLDRLSDMAEDDVELRAEVQVEFERLYPASREAFLAALVEARDVVGVYLAMALLRAVPEFFNYASFGQSLLEADASSGRFRFSRMITENFRRRQLDVLRAGPRTSALRCPHHGNGSRIAVPGASHAQAPMSFRERMLIDH